MGFGVRSLGRGAQGVECMGLGCGVGGVGCMASGCEIWVLVQGVGSEVWFRVWDLGCGVWSLRPGCGQTWRFSGDRNMS